MWVAERVAIDGMGALGDDQTYWAMDFLLDALNEIASETFSSVAHLLNLDLGIVFVDTTSTYWEIEGDVRERIIEHLTGLINGSAAWSVRRRNEFVGTLKAMPGLRRYRHPHWAATHRQAGRRARGSPGRQLAAFAVSVGRNHDRTDRNPSIAGYVHECRADPPISVPILALPARTAAIPGHRLVDALTGLPPQLTAR